MAQLNFHVPEALLSRIDASKPEYLDRKGFLCLLIEQSLDKGFTLGKPSAAQAAEPGRGEGFTSKAVSSSSSSSLNTSNKERKVRSSKVKRTKGTPEFEQFWVVYQSCPKKANAQSKFKAWECWEQLVPEVDAQDLISAAQKAVDEVKALDRANEFCAPLPDAFRWLRDERYLVLLEAHTPAQTQTVYL